jgi:FdrA protein
MTTAGRILAGQYQDSVWLMRAAEALREREGIEAAGVVMGTPRNLELLEDAALLFDGVSDATPNDIVVAVRGSAAAAEAALADAQGVVAKPQGGSTAESYASLRAAADASNASLAVISVPGEYASDEAREAIERGLDVMLFSDNVPVEEEVSLKRAASERGRLVMGPDCGTAIVHGVALGFANELPLGPVGIVAASGTGAQVVSTQLAALGTGVSHLLGLGGRDLEDAVGGLSLLPALATLEADPATEVVVIVAKKAGPEVLARLLDAVASMDTPVVACILGEGGGSALEAVGALTASSLEDAARRAKLLVDDGQAAAAQGVDWEAVSGWRSRLGPGRTLQGRFAGGTLAQEALGIARAVLGDVDSNLDPRPDAAHRILDLGADEYTAGAPHPMINPSAQAAQLADALADAATGVMLFDVVLGHGGHANPAAVLAPVVERGLEAAAAAGREVLVVASCCGTEADPQRLSTQIEMLTAAGAIVTTSNPRATGLAALAVAKAPEERSAQPLDLLSRWTGQVINVGTTWFADALSAQELGVVQVDWRPPAQGDEELRALLRELV